MDFFGGVTSLIGAGLNYFGQQETNKMQMQMMQQQNAFQEKMSSTAYQRASQDMEAAGLNPMMMFGGGSAASTPSGASPSPAVQSGLSADSFQKSVSSAVSMMTAKATVDNIIADTAEKRARTLTEAGRPENVMADTATKWERSHLTRQETKTEKERTDVAASEGEKARNVMSIPKPLRKALDMAGYSGKSISDIIDPAGNLLSSAKAIKYLRGPTGRRTTSSTTGPAGDYFTERFHY